MPKNAKAQGKSSVHLYKIFRLIDWGIWGRIRKEGCLGSLVGLVWFGSVERHVLTRSSPYGLVRKGEISPGAIEDVWKLADYRVEKVVSVVG